MFEENKQNFNLMSILDMSQLDERALSKLEDMLGKDRVDSIRNEIQNLMSKGPIDEKTITDTAERFGVPEKVVQLISQYYQNL